MSKLKTKRNSISIIIPVYNTSSTIVDCLMSLDNQSLKPLEIIIVDDGSKDNIELKIKYLKFKNLKFIKQKHKGVSEARNLGAKKAKGDIFAFIDSDCVAPPDWLEKINLAFSDLAVGAVGGGYSGGIDNSFWQKFSYEELLFRRQKRDKYVSTLLSNNMACRSSCFWQAGGFPKKYPVCEDMYLAFQIARQYKILWLKDNGVKHHFKTNLKDFLKHQYFFGKQSTLFFFDNPQILKDSNHQGRQLHVAIGTLILSLVCLFAAFILATLNRSSLGQVALVGVGMLMIIHFLLYSKFLSYLKHEGLSEINLIRVYIVSILRDLVAAISFFNGLALYIKERKF